MWIFDILNNILFLINCIKKFSQSCIKIYLFQSFLKFNVFHLPHNNNRFINEHWLSWLVSIIYIYIYSKSLWLLGHGPMLYFDVPNALTDCGSHLQVCLHGDSFDSYWMDSEIFQLASVLSSEIKVHTETKEYRLFLLCDEFMKILLDKRR